MPHHCYGRKCCICRRCAAGEEGGVDQAGKHDHRALHAHAGIGLQKCLARGARSLAGKGSQRDRRKGRIKIEPEKAPVDSQDQNKGQNGNNQTSQYGNKPQWDGLQNRHILYRRYDLARQCRHLRYRAAHTAHDRTNDAAADVEYSQHQLHAMSYGGLCTQEAHKMPQGKFGPLHLTERRGRLKDAHRKEQHEQSVPDTLQRGIDLDDQRPDVAALEALRRGRQQRPNLGQSAVPAIQRIFQCSYDPVIADRKSPPCFDRKCVPRWDAFPAFSFIALLLFCRVVRKASPPHGQSPYAAP